MGPAITPAPVFELPAIIRKYVTEIHFPRESEAERLSRSKRARCGLVFNIIIAAVILVGVGLLAYPTVADYYNQYHSTRLIAGYSDVVAGMSEADFDTMRAEAEAYNQALFGNPARFQPDEAELVKYNSILDVTGTGIMGYIEIPRIKVRLPVYHTVSETVLQIAAGHMPGTSFPIGGFGVHAVISGHSALPSAKLFTGLELLDTGDIFELHVLDDILYYQVDAVNVVLPEEMDLLALDPDHDYITLVTCTPYGVNSHRLLVRGTRVDAPIDSDMSESDDASDTGVVTHDAPGRDLRLVFVAIVLVFGLLLLFILFSGGRKSGPGMSGDGRKT